MTERFGISDGNADVQFVDCHTCEETIDLSEPHPMYETGRQNEFDDYVTRTLHFCSSDCLDAWKGEREFRE